MSSNWPEVRKIVNAALDQPPEQRRAYAEQACGNDAALREAVWSLLSDDSVPSGFLEPPIEGAAVHLAAGSADRAAAIEHMGRYRVTEVIDSGGIGTVYRAVPSDDENGPPVAVKVLKRGMTGEDMQRRFRQEQEVLARLTHRNIARFIDGGVTSGGLPYLVMEFIEGRPIDRFCDQQKLAVSDRLELFEDVCSAVQYSHRNLVVHRDLKPRNILVTDDGVPKLLDFGIAKLLEDGSSGPAPDPTVTANRMITPQYASPEQIRGAPISTATDVYSLGVVLYELLTGHRPYDLRGKGRGEILELIGEADPTSPSTQVMQTEEVTYLDGTTTTLTPELVSIARGTDPHSLRRELTGDLDTIVLTAMHKDPDRRYASVERLADDLRRYRTGLPILARPDTFNYRARKFIRRNKAATIAATVAFISLIAGTTGLGVGLKQAQTAQAQLAEEAETARIETKKAARINNFLQEMLAAANPMIQGKDVTVVETLKRAAERLENELQNDPAVRAALYETIGDTYLSLGLPRQGCDYLRVSLDLRSSSLGTAHLDTCSSMSALGVALTELGEYEGAEKHLEEALEVAVKLQGSDSELVSNILNSQGILWRQTGHLEEAEGAHRRALQIRRAVLGNNHDLVVSSMNNLAVLLQDRNELEEAGRLLREVVALRERKLAPNDPRIATGLNNLATLLERQGEIQEAEQLLVKALALKRITYDEGHPSIATSLINLSGTFIRQARYNEAEPLIEEALAIDRKNLGDTHPAVASDLNSLGGLRLGLKDWKGAAVAFEEALAIVQSVYDDAHPIQELARFNLALAKDKLGDPEAEHLFREALALQRKLLPSDHPRRASALSKLGNIRADAGSYGEAETLLKEAMKILEEQSPQNANRLLETAGLLGEILILMGKFEEADRFLLTYHAKLASAQRSAQRLERMTIVRLTNALVYLYEEWGKPEKAAVYRALLEEATGGEESEEEDIAEEPASDAKTEPAKDAGEMPADPSSTEGGGGESP